MKKLSMAQVSCDGTSHAAFLSRFNRAVRRTFPLVLLFLGGCMSPWPVIDPKLSEWTWYQPAPLASPELAVSTLKNMQDRFAPATGIPGKHTTLMEIDPFSMRVKWQWTENQTTAYSVPTYSGGFVGWTYVPMYGNTTQYATSQSQNEKLLAVPFTQIDGFSTYLYRQPNPQNPKLPFARWLLVISEDDHPEMAEMLSVPDRRTAEKLADAIATLAIAQGRKVDGGRSFGARGFPITPHQKKALGPAANDGGLLVREVAKGGQAERNGLRPMDVIIRINDQPTPDNEAAISSFRLNPARPKITYLRRQPGVDSRGRPSEQIVERTEVYER